MVLVPIIIHNCKLSTIRPRYLHMYIHRYVLIPIPIANSYVCMYIPIDIIYYGPIGNWNSIICYVQVLSILNLISTVKSQWKVKSHFILNSIAIRMIVENVYAFFYVSMYLLKCHVMFTRLSCEGCVCSKVLLESMWLVSTDKHTLQHIHRSVHSLTALFCVFVWVYILCVYYSVTGCIYMCLSEYFGKYSSINI